MALLATLARARALSSSCSRAVTMASPPQSSPRRRASSAAAASTAGDGVPRPTVQHMSVQELAELLPIDDLCEGVQFVDVREPGEFAAAKLPRFKLFPLSAAAEWSPKVEEILDPSAKTIVLCHHGVRSMNAAMFLAGEKGFTDVYNVTGGIDAYSLGADASVPRY
jgi:rhodanese-related sulfurtransferase